MELTLQNQPPTPVYEVYADDNKASHSDPGDDAVNHEVKSPKVCKIVLLCDDFR